MLTRVSRESLEVGSCCGADGEVSACSVHRCPAGWLHTCSNGNISPLISSVSRALVHGVRSSVGPCEHCQALWRWCVLCCVELQGASSTDIGVVCKRGSAEVTTRGLVAEVTTRGLVALTLKGAAESCAAGLQGSC